MREILFRGQTRRLGELVRMNGEKVPSKWVYGGICQGKGAFSIIYGSMDMRSCYNYEKKPIVFEEEWKDTCERLGYEYFEWGDTE